MAQKTNYLALGFLGVGAAVTAYALLGNSTPTSSTTPVPNNATLNTQWGTWQNNTGAPVWVTATGMVVNSAGDIMDSITNLIAAINNGNGGNGNSGGGGGIVILGPKKKKAIGNTQAGAYYNPLPGGLM